MKKSLIAVFVFVLAFSSISFAQTQEIDVIESLTGYNFYDFDYVGSGARAKGMGNAFLAVSNDVGSGAWNPAGIFEIDESIISLNYSSFRPKGNSNTVFNNNSVDLDHSGTLGDITSFNFVSPIRLKGHPFVFSANLTRNFDAFTNLRVKTTLDTILVTQFGLVTYEDTTSFAVDRVAKMTGGINSINFGFGTRFYDNISFGVAINIYTGNTLFEVNENVTTSSVRIPPTQFVHFDQFVTIRDTNKFSGSNFTIGFKRNGDRTNAALVVRTPFDLSENRQQAIFKITEFNQIVWDPLTDSTFFGDILYKYEMPWIIGFGLSRQQSENLLLAIDAEYRPYSGKKIFRRVSQIINPGGSNIEEFIVFDPNWNNVFTFRVGAEHMREYGIGTIPLRAGFGYIPIPDPSVDSDGNLSTVVNYNFSLGTGLHWEQIKFDLSYSYTKSNRDFPGIESDLNFKNHSINFSFTGIF